MLRRLTIAAVALLALALPGASVRPALAVDIPTPTPLRPLVILTVGDSITCGPPYDTCDPNGGYRAEVGRLLTLAGVPYQFVVDAHSAWSCDALRSTAPAAVTANNPDFVMLDCGTNDMPDAAHADAFATVYADLLNKMWAASPSGQLKVLPSWIQYSANFNQSPHAALQITEPIVNDGIYRIWKSATQTQTGQMTTPVDLQQIPEAYLDSGGIHPTAAGYTVMGRLWYRMLRDSYYYDRGWPDPPVTCGLTGHRPGGFTPTYVPCTGLASP